ncbi:hypothetical protein Poly59_33040 [Rubripirellula reticaptiva]|uniref:Uncharacterized protein n=2 Tax=Rubripirellula reticaptiva TaxID=2528013 RepID=A0A5C6EW54_9BACT|nr:hypothetical protein Poly59_33040 [Rubripirellula reticaptiva]
MCFEFACEEFFGIKQLVQGVLHHRSYEFIDMTANGITDNLDCNLDIFTGSFFKPLQYKRSFASQ